MGRPHADGNKKPRVVRGFSRAPFAAYLLRPEPGPVGASVDPLGEALGARVFPEGFILVFRFGEVVPVEDPVPMPTVPPVPVPLIDEPVAAPPVEPPVELPPPCAKARVLDSARAPASAIVVSFMTVSSRSNDSRTTRQGAVMFRHYRSIEPWDHSHKNVHSAATPFGWLPPDVTTTIAAATTFAPALARIGSV
jgi:hypothetical protein